MSLGAVDVKSDATRTQPLVTLVILGYNQERYIEEAVEGALRQTYSPLEIILSDDFSTDRTFEIMQRMAEAYSGTHCLRLNRNPRNLGLADHLNRVVELANGSIIILAAGDDISLPSRAQLVAEAFATDFSIKAVLSSYMIIDEHGEVTGAVRLPKDFSAFTPLSTIAKSGGWIGMGAALAYHRDCFVHPGPIPTEILCEDCLLPFRAAFLGRIVHINEPLLLYRTHGESATAQSRFTAETYRLEHQRVLFGELDWARRRDLIDDETYAESRAGLNAYLSYFRQMERLGRGIRARLYSAFYHRDVWARRVWFRLRASRPKWL